jgi:hypothetical protein
MNGIKRIQVEEDDVHARLMRRYPEVPNGWYYTLTATFFIVAIVAVEVWPTGMPVWALCLSLLLPALYLLPCGFIYAVTGQSLAINLLAEILPGTLLAGKPFPNMVRHGNSILKNECSQFCRSSKHSPFKRLIHPSTLSKISSSVTT